MDTAVGVVEEEGPAATTSLLIASTLIGDAVAAAERRGLDECLLHVVEELRRVSRLLDE
jgi:hypothetical protein